MESEAVEEVAEVVIETKVLEVVTVCVLVEGEAAKQEMTLTLVDHLQCFHEYEGEEFEALKESIRLNGQFHPIQIDELGQVLIGHMRLLVSAVMRFVLDVLARRAALCSRATGGSGNAPRSGELAPIAAPLLNRRLRWTSVRRRASKTASSRRRSFP